MRHPIVITLLTLCLASGTACTPMVEYIATAQESGNPRKGVTYYVGGAGPMGNVGSWDVPRGLADAGYLGLVEVYTWQGMTHAGDQINLGRNRQKAAELALRIKAYWQRYPRRQINIVALSAGTGIAAFALEYLPERVQIDNAVFLGCSLSSHYDLTRALRRVKGRVYVLYSPDDDILQKLVWATGTVDRSPAAEGIAGLEGFHLPSRLGRDTSLQYAKICNVEYRSEFAETGYKGGHMDSTTRAFIRDYVAEALTGDDRRLVGPRPAAGFARQRAESEVGVSNRPGPSVRDREPADHGPISTRP